MSTPLSFCDISTRYGQAPAPQKTVEEQTGWNPKQFFLDYLMKVREQREQNAKEAEEDALMEMIDAMNASEQDKKAGRTDMAAANSLKKAGEAIIERYEGQVDPLATATIQALLACLGDRFTFEEVDEVQENQEQAKEQQDGEERLEVTEPHESGESRDPESL